MDQHRALNEAVVSLRPDAEFVLRGETVDGIEWLQEGVEPLTQAEADAEVARLASQREAVEALRASARLKIAEASGLTPDEMTALGL